MNIDLTPILQAVIALVAALIAYRLIPYIKSKTTLEQQKMLQATVKTLVFAAEQMFGAGFGEEKLKWVEEALKERGFTYKRADIEAAVKEYFSFSFFDEPSEKVSESTNPVEKTPDEVEADRDFARIGELIKMGATAEEMKGAKTSEELEALYEMYRRKQEDFTTEK